MFDDLPALMEVEDVATYLHSAPETVRRMLREGRLVGVRVGRKWLVSKDELRAYIERQTGAVVRRPRPKSEEGGSGPVGLAGGRQHPARAAGLGDEEPDAEEQAAPPRTPRRASFDGARAPAAYRLVG